MAKKTASTKSAKRLTITLRKSTIGFNKTQAKTVQGLGLRTDQPQRGSAGHAGNARNDSQGPASRRGQRVIMDLSNLKPSERSKFPKKRVGRGQGSGNGVQAGRGHKGAKSRSGFKFKRGFEGGQMPLHRRVPKRGFHNIFRTEYAVVNLDTLAERFDEGTVVTPDLLREAGLIHSTRQPIKVLARGDVSKKLTVQAHKFSGKAAEKIQAAGGATHMLVAGSK
jgi:large subunit ribosomal protein L15